MILKIDIKNIHKGKINLYIEPISFSQDADVYYFAIDNNVRAINDITKIFLGFKNLLKKWLKCTDSLFHKKNDLIYLPYDFSDQYIGLIRIRRISDKFYIDYGYTEEIQGFSIYPSQVICYTELTNYESLSDTNECNLKDLANSILIAIEEINSQIINNDNLAADLN